MTSHTLKKHIAAPMERVFDLATDFAHAPRHVTGIRRVEMLTNGPVRVGTKFKETRAFTKEETAEVLEVTAFERPSRYALTSRNGGCDLRTEYRFTGSGGETDVEMQFEVRPHSLVTKIMPFMAKPLLSLFMKATEKDLDDIKSRAESNASVSIS